MRNFDGVLVIALRWLRKTCNFILFCLVCILTALSAGCLFLAGNLTRLELEED